jgi:hypothetical protein
MERVIGVEPTTLCLASIRSSQLSYTRILLKLYEHKDIVNLDKLTAGKPGLSKAKKLQVIIDSRP